MEGISCKSLTVRRRRKDVIRDFNLTASAECVVLEGLESGTLLEVLAGWRKAPSENVKLSGSVSALLPGEQLPVYWTGADWLSYCGVPDPDVLALLNSSGIRLNKIIRNLDPREKSFIASVSTLLSRANNYLLYEPFRGMSELEAKSALEIFQKRAAAGATVLFAFEHYGWPFSLRKVSL